MPIVSQLAPVSHAPFPPLLMLPAPRIAGLLPARVTSTHSSGEAYREPIIDSFTFTDPRLADLPVDEVQRLLTAAQALLATAVSFMSGTQSDARLRAAEVVFHRAAGGESIVRPRGPAAYKAEVNADIIEWADGAKQRMAANRERAKDFLRERFGSYWRDTADPETIRRFDEETNHFERLNRVNNTDGAEAETP